MIKTILSEYTSLISFIGSILIFIFILYYKANEIKEDKIYLKLIISYWFIYTIVLGFGFVFSGFLRILLHQGLSYGSIIIRKFIVMVVLNIMDASFFGILLSMITIKESKFFKDF